MLISDEIKYFADIKNNAFEEFLMTWESIYNISRMQKLYIQYMSSN